MNKTVLITGATSGIGEACAKKYAADGDRLILTGRRADRLNALKTELEKDFSTEILALIFDVQDKKAVDKNLGTLPTEWQKIDLLINNAGLAAGKDSFENADINDWETMFNTNVHGLLYVSKQIIPLMIANKKGHVVNIGSIAGKEVYENGNVYCASKFAVDAISKSMRIDLLKHSIKVTCIHPGAVETEFSLVRFKGDKNKAAATYNGMVPLSGNDIADSIFYCTQLPDHVCINELVITPTQQANAYYTHRSL
jgi:3-hydroxy acid dehydrogenase/malonic semialdehyde reductase